MIARFEGASARVSRLRSSTGTFDLTVIHWLAPDDPMARDIWAFNNLCCQDRRLMLLENRNHLAVQGTSRVDDVIAQEHSRRLIPSEGSSDQMA